MSELLYGPPLRLGTVSRGLPPDIVFRLGAVVQIEGSPQTAMVVFATDDALSTVMANTLLVIGAARTHRALMALLKASRDQALGLDQGSDRSEAENRLDRAECEASAALAAASPSMVPVGHQDAPESGS